MSRSDKRWTIVAMLLVVVTVVVIGCGPAATPTEAPAAEPTKEPAAEEPTAVPEPTEAPEPEQEQVTLRFTFGGGPALEALQVIADKYHEENPNITIQFDLQPDDMNWQKAAPTTMFAAPDGPDASWWWCANMAQFPDMVDAGLVAPLDDLYEREGWYDAFPQAFVDYYSFGGHVYAVSNDLVWTPFVYYNKDVFAEVGIEPPTTWDEMYDISDKLRAAGYQPLALVYEMSVRSHLPDGLMFSSWTEEEYQAFLVNWQPDAPEWSLEHKWTDPNGVRIYQTIKDMADKGVFVEGFAGITDYAQAKSMFTSGKAAMYQDGSWAGGVGVLEEEVDFDFGYFYYPPLNNEAPRFGQAGSYIANCFIVFQGRDEDKSEYAKDFVAYILQPENMLTYLSEGGNPPGRMDLPADKVAEILGPVTAQMSQDIAEAGTMSLYEGVCPPELLASLKESIDLMLTTGLSPEEAAAMQQEATEAYRAGE